MADWNLGRNNQNILYNQYWNASLMNPKQIKYDIINYLGRQASTGCLPALSIHMVFKNVYYNNDEIRFDDFKECYKELLADGILKKHIGKSNKIYYSLGDDFFWEKNVIERYEYLMHILKPNIPVLTS
jgi:hypothetical protein